MVSPDRLSNPYQQTDTHRLRGGVEIDDFGAPLGYHIRKAHQNDYFDAQLSMEWEFYPRETPWGRPIVVHHYEFEDIAQHRGLGVLTPVLNRLRMLMRYDSAELQQALIQTIFGFFLQSPYDRADVQGALAGSIDDPGEASAYQQLREGFHGGNPLSVGGVRISMLAPGETIGTVNPTRPNSNFDPFQAVFLRNLAAATGQSAEQISWDYSKTNYSSARAALLESWKTLTRRRENFAVGFANPVYCAWLEEAIDSGRVPLPAGAPDFVEMRAAYARCRWIGPARGWVDPVAERQGAVLGLDAGFGTLEDECAEQGRDYEETLDQREVEVRMFRDRGLPMPEWAAGMPATQTAQPQQKPDAQ
jgi:lambda family phage portal protein